MFLTMFEQKPKHRINDASNDVNRPPLQCPAPDQLNTSHPAKVEHRESVGASSSAITDICMMN